MNTIQSVALVGVGTVGSGLATTLLEAGYKPLLWDRREEALAPFRETAANLAGGLDEVQADVVILSLPETSNVEEVVLGDKGLASSMQPGSVILDMSTGIPAVSARLAEAVRSRGIEMLDAPISFEKNGREVQVGGSCEIYERLTPLLDILTARHTYIGGNGQGNLAKLAKNMINAGYFTIISEAFAFAVKQGADPALLFDCIKDSAAESVLLQRFPDQVLSGAFRAKGSVGIHTKDLRYALEAGRDHNAILPVTSYLHEVFNWTSKKYGPSWSQYKIISFYETVNGIRVESPKQDS